MEGTVYETAVYCPHINALRHCCASRKACNRFAEVASYVASAVRTCLRAYTPVRNAAQPQALAYNSLWSRRKGRRAIHQASVQSCRSQRHPKKGSRQTVCQLPRLRSRLFAAGLSGLQCRGGQSQQKSACQETEVGSPRHIQRLYFVLYLSRTTAGGIVQAQVA